jgi:hypothetical protein
MATSARPFFVFALGLVMALLAFVPVLLIFHEIFSVLSDD